MKKIPVYIISGFLGSGKTTAIIRLLRQKQPDESWAIVVNEFGKISIDAQTLKEESTTGEVFDISGGCICCSAKGYLRENLVKIIEADSFDRIIIEPSGLGGIEMVSEITRTLPQLSLMPVVCMVDISGMNNSRLRFIPFYRAQISKADVIVFSKCDLITDKLEQERLIETFKEAFPDKKRFLNAETNFISSLSDRNESLTGAENILQVIFSPRASLHDENYLQKSYTFGADAIFDTELLTRFFAAHPFIVRGKGHIRTKNGWKLLNFTLTGCTFEPCQEKGRNEIIIIAEKSGLDRLPGFDEELLPVRLHG